MSKSDDLYCVDLTTPSHCRKLDSVVDLTSADDDVEVVVPAAKRQKQQQLMLHFSDSDTEVEAEPISTSTSSSSSEHRALPFRKSASKELQDRIHRVHTRRIFLIQQRPSTNSLEREFVVIGHNGNVYTVKISIKPQCDCEDNKNGQGSCNCEHILFVYLKVFKLSTNDPVIWQKALLSSEVQAIFNSYTTCQPSILADPSVTEKYLEITRPERKQKKLVPRKPIEGDCPICFEKLKEEDGLVWCKYSCGNNVHETCFKQWRDTKTDVGQEVKCTYCRARWDQGAESLRKALTKDGYLNLSDFQSPMLRDIPGPYLYLLPQLLQLTSRLPWPLAAEEDEEEDEDFNDMDDDDEDEFDDDEDDY